MTPITFAAFADHVDPDNVLTVEGVVAEARRRGFRVQLDGEDLDLDGVDLAAEEVDGFDLDARDLEVLTFDAEGLSLTACAEHPDRILGDDVADYLRFGWSDCDEDGCGRFAAARALDDDAIPEFLDALGRMDAIAFAMLRTLVAEDTAAGLARPVEGTDPVPSPELLARLAALSDDRTPVGIYWHPDAVDPATGLGGWAIEIADWTGHGRTAAEALTVAEERAGARGEA